MKSKGRKKDKVNIVTLGCSKNIVDSEVMLTQLRGNFINTTHESEMDDANIVVINTCGFIDNAKQESIDTILRYAEAKEEGKVEKVFVTGCLSERYRLDIQKEIKNVDGWFGTMELPLLLNRFSATYKNELLGERITTTKNHYSYLKISEGCDRPCSFCAIPLMRGKHVSKPIEEILLEAKNLVKNGAKEILLIAQDSTYYGLDIYKERALADLMDQLADVEGIDWIRLHYAFPTGFPMEVLEVMAKRRNICNYLDLPLQHGSTHMLKLMRRGTTREKTEALINMIRKKIPKIAIRTSLIVGHPGETEEIFLEMMDFVKKNRFERLGVFAYSHEEDTHSYAMKDDVPDEVKQQRFEAIMELQEVISEEINAEKVGKKYCVLIDRYEGGQYVGRTEHDSPEVDNEVLIRSDDGYLRVGDFCEVVITSASAFDLYAKPVKE